jgi:hypothetical protein
MDFSGSIGYRIEEQKALVKMLELLSNSSRTKTRRLCEFKKMAAVIC